MKIGIVGGEGSMGRVFSGVFSSQGVECLVSDLNTTLKTDQLVKTSDVILIAVQIGRTLDVIGEISELLREDQMIADLTSVKVAPVSKMLETRAEVLGLHPMFGPGLNTVAGQTVIYCKARTGRYTQSFLNILTNAGLVLKESTPEKHDKLMSAVQGLNHINALLMAKTLADMNADLKECLEFGSPSYKIRSHFLSRLMSEPAELYAGISLSNPANREVAELLKKNTEQVLNTLISNNKNDFVSLFNQAADYFSDIKQSGYDTSTELINYLTASKK